MKPWAIFESRIESESRQKYITINKIPENVRVFKGRVIRKKTQFDFSGGIDGLCFVFDAKASAKKDFNFQSYLLEPKKVHQFNALKDARENNNISGLLIHFYELGKICWASTETIISAIESGKKGLKPCSLGVISQPDNLAINLRLLLSRDLSAQVCSLRGINGENRG